MSRPENKEKRRLYSQKVYTTDYRWAIHIKVKFNMTPGDYKNMLNTQNNKCAVCGETAMSQESAHGAKGKLDIDHCHKTGQVRGLLCKRCNKGLGAFKDAPELLEAALNYIRTVSSYQFYTAPGKGYSRAVKPPEPS